MKKIAIFLKSIKDKKIFVFGANMVEILSIITFVGTLIIKLIDTESQITVVPRFIEFKLANISDLLLWATIGVWVYKLIEQLYKYRRQYTIIYHCDANDDSLLTKTSHLCDDYKNNSYEIRKFGDACFLFSNTINRHIQNHKYKINPIKRRYKLVKEIKPLVAYIIKVLNEKNKNGLIFNSKKIRLRTDLIDDIKNVTLEKTSYFDSICTNEVCKYRFRSYDSAIDVLSGKQLLIDEMDYYYSLGTSPCSNHIGVSSLLETSDNKIVIFKQSNKSAQNKNKLVPSASGSLDYKDLKKSSTLQDLVIKGIQRELHEECGLKDVAKVEINSTIEGYARYLDRGGKPEFFIYSKVNVSSEQITIKTEEKIFQDKEILLDIKFKNNQGIQTIDWDTMRIGLQEKGILSPQLEYLFYLLEGKMGTVC